ncbi:MAG: hypothetical protein K9M36_03200 [Candidatus Pacebacteria bacterium]|nr:hypothetical protein [Candidatus Paceibacterota bacterium]
MSIALWLKNFLGITVFQREVDKQIKDLKEEMYLEINKLASQKKFDELLGIVMGLRGNLETVTRTALKHEEMLTPAKVASITDPSLKKFDKFSVRVNHGSSKDEVTLGLSHPVFSEEDKYFSFASSSFRFPEFRPMSRGGNYVFIDGYVLTNEEGPKKIVKALYATHQVAVIHITSAFEIVLQKPAALSWEDVLPKIYKALEEHFSGLEEEVSTPAESSTQES